MTTTPRSRAIMLHVTEAEYGRIQAAAARFSVPIATFARIQVLLASPEAKPVRPPKPLKAVRYENLSQMHASGLYVMGPTAADGSISFVEIATTKPSRTSRRGAGNEATSRHRQPSSPPPGNGRRRSAWTSPRYTGRMCRPDRTASTRARTLPRLPRPDPNGWRARTGEGKQASRPSPTTTTPDAAR